MSCGNCGERPCGRARQAGQREAVKVVRRTRRWRAGGTGGERRDCTGGQEAQVGAAGRGTVSIPTFGEQWSLVLLQASMLKGAEQEECLAACLHCECRRPEGLRQEEAESEGRWRAAGPGGGGGRGAAP